MAADSVSVVATGMDSELGHISQLVEQAVPEASPLEKRLARLSGQLVWVTLLLTAVIGGIGLAEGKDTFLMVEAAIALAIAAIPEGLPDRGDARTRTGHVADGPTERADRAPVGRRDPRRDDRHSHR